MTFLWKTTRTLYLRHSASDCMPDLRRTRAVKQNTNAWSNRPISQIPGCICAIISHNASFCNRNVHMCAHFCYKMMHCGIFVSCILGFVRCVYWAYYSWGYYSSWCLWLLPSHCSSPEDRVPTDFMLGYQTWSWNDFKIGYQESSPYDDRQSDNSVRHFQTWACRRRTGYQWCCIWYQYIHMW